MWFVMGTSVFICNGFVFLQHGLDLSSCLSVLPLELLAKEITFKNKDHPIPDTSIWIHQFEENSELNPTSIFYCEVRNQLPLVSFHLVEALSRPPLPFHISSPSLSRSIVSIVFVHVRLLECMFWYDAHPIFGLEEGNPEPELDGGSYVIQLWWAF